VIFITLFFCHLSLFFPLSRSNLAVPKKDYPNHQEVFVSIRSRLAKKMKKKILFSTQSQSAVVDGLKVQRVLPNKFVQAMGPFVLLDHVLSCKQSSDASHKADNGKCAHPHRGVATLTYIINGEVEHADSMGNHVKLSSGGVHWMKAGKGVVHDEAINTGCKTNGTDISVVQFWINLPSQHKCDNPFYLSLSDHVVSKQILKHNTGWIKVLLGKYENAVAKIPGYSKQFLFHVHLEAGKQFLTITENGLECAAFLPKDHAVINDTEFEAAELIVFDSEGETTEIYNNSEAGIDVLLFGGEPYTERMILDGTFVMNTPHEITQAYNDYYDGKYGEIPTGKNRESFIIF
jgi:redox-sensitive bicupin YhaK (pirin superfamily)